MAGKQPGDGQDVRILWRLQLQPGAERNRRRGRLAGGVCKPSERMEEAKR